MIYKIDLHTHTIFSDGGSTPEELINTAVEQNVKAIALTDHDNIEGIEEAARLAKANNIDFLPGIEISARYKDDRVLHILGLGIDYTNEEFLYVYNRMKQARHQRVNLILSSIKEKGISIDIEELREKALGPYLGRHDIFRYFMRKKLCKTPQEVWDKYLDIVPYSEDELIDVKDAIRIIKSAGGSSFLAHYNKPIGLGGLSAEGMEEEIEYLISLGLDGVERYYPSFNEADYKFLDYLIEKYSLMISGGTDYHGKNRPDIELGSGKDNNLFIPYDVYTKISEKR